MAADPSLRHKKPRREKAIGKGEIQYTQKQHRGALCKYRSYIINWDYTKIRVSRRDFYNSAISPYTPSLKTQRPKNPINKN